MATHTRYFRWDDASAPTLSGTAGSLIELLRACLVGTDGVAYGSGGTEKLAAGWTEEFTGTNVAVFRNSLAAGGTGCYLRVDDSGSGTGGAREALQRCYGSMSDIDTGTDATPDEEALETGIVVRKSATADSTARKWILCCDELTLWLWIESNASSAAENSIYGAGDYESFVVGEATNFFCAGRIAENSTAGQCGFMIGKSSGATNDGGNQLGMWVARRYSLLAGSGAVSIAVFAKTNNSTIAASTGTPIPSPDPGVDGRVYMPALLLAENSLRGRLRLVYVPLCDLSGSSAGDVDVGPFGAETRTLVIAKAQSASTSTSNLGSLAFDAGMSA